jgi:hypothetical protein
MGLQNTFALGGQTLNCVGRFQFRAFKKLHFLAGLSGLRTRFEGALDGFVGITGE